MAKTVRTEAVRIAQTESSVTTPGLMASTGRLDQRRQSTLGSSWQRAFSHPSALAAAVGRATAWCKRSAKRRAPGNPRYGSPGACAGIGLRAEWKGTSFACRAMRSSGQARLHRGHSGVASKALRDSTPEPGVAAQTCRSPTPPSPRRRRRPCGGLRRPCGRWWRSSRRGCRCRIRASGRSRGRTSPPRRAASPSRR